MHRVKAGGSVALVLLPLAGLLALALPAGSALHTFGRRLAVGKGDLLLLTDADRDRVAVYDVSGDAPRKRAEFGSRGIRPGRLRAPHGAIVDGKVTTLKVSTKALRSGLVQKAPRVKRRIQKEG